MNIGFWFKKQTATSRPIFSRLRRNVNYHHEKKQFNHTFNYSNNNKLNNCIYTIPTATNTAVGDFDNNNNSRYNNNNFNNNNTRNRYIPLIMSRNSNHQEIPHGRNFDNRGNYRSRSKSPHESHGRGDFKHQRNYRSRSSSPEETSGRGSDRNQTYVEHQRKYRSRSSSPEETKEAGDQVNYRNHKHEPPGDNRSRWSSLEDPYGHRDENDRNQGYTNPRGRYDPYSEKASSRRVREYDNRNYRGHYEHQENYQPHSHFSREEFFDGPGHGGGGGVDRNQRYNERYERRDDHGNRYENFGNQDQRYERHHHRNRGRSHEERSLTDDDYRRGSDYRSHYGNFSHRDNNIFHNRGSFGRFSRDSLDQIQGPGLLGNSPAGFGRDRQGDGFNHNFRGFNRDASNRGQSSGLLGTFPGSFSREEGDWHHGKRNYHSESHDRRNYSEHNNQCHNGNHHKHGYKHNIHNYALLQHRTRHEGRGHSQGYKLKEVSVNMEDDVNDSKRILVVIDLNGFLFDREFIESDQKFPEDCIRKGNFAVYQRPHLKFFLNWLFDNFHVGVWSSARVHNINNLLQDDRFGFTHPINFVFDQRECIRIDPPKKESVITITNGSSHESNDETPTIKSDTELENDAIDKEWSDAEVDTDDNPTKDIDRKRKIRQRKKAQIIAKVKSAPDILSKSNSIPPNSGTDSIHQEREVEEIKFTLQDSEEKQPSEKLQIDIQTETQPKSAQTSTPAPTQTPTKQKKKGKLAKKDKPLFLKDLHTLWEKFPRWNATNTIIVDDSIAKLSRNPTHTSLCPMTWTKDHSDDSSLCEGGQIYEYLHDLLVSCQTEVAKPENAEKLFDIQCFVEARPFTDTNMEPVKD